LFPEQLAGAREPEEREMRDYESEEGSSYLILSVSRRSVNSGVMLLVKGVNPEVNYD
jgi:hypothetical protein